MKNNRIWLFLILFCYSISCAASETESEASAHNHHNHEADANTPIWSISENVRVAFELTAANGQTRTQKDYLGRYVLLSFGFTHCEYVCPTIAAKMSQALELTTENAVGLFISLDTERDTPVQTHLYAKKFGEHMEGLSGNYEQIAEAANNFDVSFAVTKSQDNYTVQHSANIYLIDSEGNLVDIYALNSSPEDIAGAIK